jgi:hypothetical protein
MLLGAVSSTPGRFPWGAFQQSKLEKQMTNAPQDVNPVIPPGTMTPINVSLRGVVQLHPQEAHWIANAAGAQADLMGRALAANNVPIEHLRESKAMAQGLRNLSQKAVHAYNEMVDVEGVAKTPEDN